MQLVQLSCMVRFRTVLLIGLQTTHTTALQMDLVQHRVLLLL